MIRLIWKLVLICLGLAVVIYGTAFSYYNAYPVALDLVIYILPALPVGVLLLASMLVGFIVALVVCSLTILRLRVSNRRLTHKLNTVQSVADATKSTTVNKDT